jgi:hypothetical protein
MAGVTLAKINGTLDAFGSSLGEVEMGFHASSGSAVKGWNPWFQADSSESTAAVVYSGTSATDLVEGGDSTAGIGFGRRYQDGGHIRVIATSGNGGVMGSGGQVCSYDTASNGGQIVQSSPAVGAFLANGQVGIASGIGYYPGTGPQGPYRGASNEVLALNLACKVQWKATTDYETSSPILADVTGTGRLAVVVGTQDVSIHGQPSHGSLYAFDAQTGQLLWHVATGAIMGSPVAADLTGSGYDDLVVATTSPTGGGLQIIDGRTGAVVARKTGFSGQNSPLITADPNGRIGITVAGYNTGTWGSACSNSSGRCFAGVIYHYEIAGSSTTWLHDAVSWPQFHHDQALSGNISS